MRAETSFSQRDPEALALVNKLATLKGNKAQYRDTMLAIGRHLAIGIAPLLPTDRHICIVCSVEDADFLARGFLEQLTMPNGVPKDCVHLLCLWNDKIREGGISLSPVIKQYKEDFPKKSIIVVIKSIISGACVVKTNLSRAISFADPETIFVAAPVMLVGAENRLAQEFPLEISNRFQFVHFATDTEKNGEDVVPGIGGSVYELLGLGNSREKNKYVPHIVKERREQLFA
jgi:hypothetical protein